MSYSKRKCQGCKGFKQGEGDFCRRCTLWRTKFSVEPKDANKLYWKQSGLCAICHKPPTATRALATDHDHKTGKIRGFICTRCNMGIGYLSSPALLQAAVSYLSAEPPKMRYLTKPVRIKLTEDDIRAVVDDPGLNGLRTKARALAGMKGINPDAALSRVRRFKNNSPTGCGVSSRTTAP